MHFAAAPPHKSTVKNTLKALCFADFLQYLQYPPKGGICTLLRVFPPCCQAAEGSENNEESCKILLKCKLFTQRGSIVKHIDFHSFSHFFPGWAVLWLKYPMCCPGTAFSSATPKFSISEHLAGLVAGLDGLAFNCFQLQVCHASPVVFVLASDASSSGKHQLHHPIYSKFML